MQINHVLIQNKVLYVGINWLCIIWQKDTASVKLGSLCFEGNTSRPLPD